MCLVVKLFSCFKQCYFRLCLIHKAFKGSGRHFPFINNGNEGNQRERSEYKCFMLFFQIFFKIN